MEHVGSVQMVTPSRALSVGQADNSAAWRFVEQQPAERARSLPQPQQAGQLQQQQRFPPRVAHDPAFPASKAARVLFAGHRRTRPPMLNQRGLVPAEARRPRTRLSTSQIENMAASRNRLATAAITAVWCVTPAAMRGADSFPIWAFCVEARLAHPRLKVSRKIYGLPTSRNPRRRVMWQ